LSPLLAHEQGLHLPKGETHSIFSVSAQAHNLHVRITLHVLDLHAARAATSMSHSGRHFKEYSRSSNTGALPQVSLDDSRISVFVKGIPGHDSEVMRMCVGLGFGLDCSCWTFALLFCRTRNKT
jgi:hypothetical protein